MSREELQRLAGRRRSDPAFAGQVRRAPRAALREFDLTEEEIRRVMLPNFGWLVEGRLAGVGRPTGADALATLHALGVRALLSLSEEPLDAALLAAVGLRAEHLPVVDYTAPTIAQVERAIAVIDGFLDEGVPIAVHCAAGLGRTGTILACYLVRQGLTADDAMREVRALRPGSIETPEQEAIVAEYERAVGRAKR